MKKKHHQSCFGPRLFVLNGQQMSYNFAKLIATLLSSWLQRRYCSHPGIGSLTVDNVFQSHYGAMGFRSVGSRRYQLSRPARVECWHNDNSRASFRVALKRRITVTNSQMVCGQFAGNFVGLFYVCAGRLLRQAGRSDNAGARPSWRHIGPTPPLTFDARRRSVTDRERAGSLETCRRTLITGCKRVISVRHLCRPTAYRSSVAREKDFRFSTTSQSAISSSCICIFWGIVLVAFLCLFVCMCVCLTAAKKLIKNYTD